MKYLLVLLAILAGSPAVAQTVCVSGSTKESEVVTFLLEGEPTDADIIFTLNEMVRQEIPVKVRPIVLEAVTRPREAVKQTDARPQKKEVKPAWYHVNLRWPRF